MGWFSAELTSEERAHKARLMVSVLRTMVGLGCLGFVVSMLDARNKVSVNLAFYAPVFLILYGMWRLVARGRVVAAAWASTLFFWILIATATLFFGGLAGGNATAFGACVMLVGSLVGGRAAITMAVASALWCGLIVGLGLTDSMPPQLGPATEVNAWIATTITLILISVLMRASLDAMRAVNRQAAEAAAERDEALRRTIQAQKMELVGNLASGVAHDFNNLLTVIGSTSNALREDHAAGRSLEIEQLDDLDAATGRAVLMTRQLLSFGRVQSSEATTVDLSELVQRLGGMLPRLLGAKIVLALDVTPGMVVRASPAALEQVLLNLAVNAREAMPTGGRLAIAVTGDDAHVRLVVEDTGVGMSAELRERAFAPFFTTKATGTGLGLATVRSAVDRFGGTITVASELGRGTTFEIRLARVVGANAPVVAPKPEAARAPALLGRILLAEDDPLVRRTMVRLLEQAGYEVVAVTNGAEALGILERVTDFDCVVSDIAMPVLDGDALSARIRELYPQLPVLLMSGNRGPAMVAEHRDFLEKPVERTVLLATLERLIR